MSGEFEMPFDGEVRENGMWYLSVEKKRSKEEYVQVKSEEGVTMEVKPKGGVNIMAKKDSSLSMKLGLTLNLGNYESARIDVGATVPTPEGEMDEKYDEMKEYLSGKLNKEIEEIRNPKEK